MRLFVSLTFLFFSFFFNSSFYAQTPGAKWVEGLEKRQQLAEQSIVNTIPFRSVGPTVFGGRIVDVAVNPERPSHFYVAYASGGVWVTKNNGASFDPIFDDQLIINIGALAVDWKRNTIWVGTGEVNSSRSSYAGIGVFKSTDEGKSWQYLGLPESHHISQIILHPSDPNTAWVAVLGHLYTANQERGIYKTTDGGKSWERTLFVNENAGASDLMIDPKNPKILFASIWERERRAWNFVEGGAGSGIYKSTDGGSNWSRLNTPKSGFPTGEFTGRIGLAQSGGNLFAIVDNYNRRPKEKKKDEKELTKDRLKEMDKVEFLKLEKEVITTFLKKNNFPKKYTAENIIEKIENDEVDLVTLADYNYDANRQLFDTQVVGAEVYRSTDGGKTWSKTHDGYLDDLYFSYGYYFGQISVSPVDPNKIYIYGVPVLRSDDGGKTFVSINKSNVHVDHHVLWVNPNLPGHIILGNDGGVNISYDDGEHWYKCNSVPAGQFYAVNVDMETPYNIYGGLQDNGVWKGPSTYKASPYWHNSGQYPYRSIMGGDGMQIEIDPRNTDIVYTGFQFGNYYRLNLESGERKAIQPRHELGETPLRWNWQTPIQLSKHNPDILYMGANRLYRSMNKGESFELISGDLTTGGKKGDVPFGTLSSIHESSLQFGLIYVGSDDGLVHVTRDGGYKWEQVNAGLPTDLWVSRIQASMYKKERVYLSLNGYRNDDFTSYVYRSENYGKSWERIGLNLPPEPVNVIKEDPKNEDVIYVGTDQGLYVSLNRGEDFMLMNNGLPPVAIHDLVVHPRDHDLVVGTHGRSIYVGPVAALQALTEDVMNNELTLMEVPSIKHKKNWGNKNYKWAEVNQPDFQFIVYSGQDREETFEVFTDKSNLITSKKIKLKKGLNFIEYDLSVAKKWQNNYEQYLEEKPEPADNGKVYLQKGTYKLQVGRDKKRNTKKFELK